MENVGRTWQEIYPSWIVTSVNGKALLAAINQAKREKTIWDIQHPHYVTNNGAYGGTPLVDGAGQTGSTLNIKDGDINITNWARKGDLVLVAGIQSPFDVNADGDTNGSGDIALSIHPPIFTGQEPADAAAVTVAAASIFLKAVLAGVSMPDIESDGVVLPGMTLAWREQPSA
jgi:hypothetical protein